MKRVVFDSFAILTYLGDEEGADIIDNLIQKAENQEISIYMNLINLGEVYYIITRDFGMQKADETIFILKKLPITFVEVTENLIIAATRVKGLHSLSYADAFVIATAIDKNATIITGDPEFKGVYPNIMWIGHVE